MRADLLKNMIIEEIRMHSSLHGMRSVVLFPVFLFFGVAIFSFILLNYSTFTLDYLSLAFFFTMIFFIFGVISGTFGLHATDYLERRFGDYGKLFSNALVLPIRLGDIFLAAAISDCIFYLGWFIVPIVGGFLLALIISGLSAAGIPLLFIATVIAFGLGIALSFLMSVLFTKSRALFMVLVGGIAAAISLAIISGHGITRWFLPYLLFTDPSPAAFAGNIILITSLVYLAIKAVGSEYAISRKKAEIRSFSFKSIDHFIFKDIIDLYRSHGIIAKPLFNVTIPSLLMLGLLSSLTILPGEMGMITQNLIFFGIVIGTLSINFFNILMMSDSFSYYQFLPVSLKEFMAPKIIITQLLCSLQGIILILIYAAIHSIKTDIAASILMMIGFIYYTISVNFFINGLKPNENSLNIPSLAGLAAFLIPVLLLGMVLPLFYHSLVVFGIFSIVLLALGHLFIYLGLARWSNHIMKS